MPCNRKPLIKKWDHPRTIPVITPSKYEKNETSVKLHWKKVLNDLELSYKDERFWESSADQVQELVGPEVFARIVKIFNLPKTSAHYEPHSDQSSVVSSTAFYKTKLDEDQSTEVYSVSQSMDESAGEEEIGDHYQDEEVNEEETSESSVTPLQDDKNNISKSKSQILSKTFIKSAASVAMTKSSFHRSKSRTLKSMSSGEQSATTNDDIYVHVEKLKKHRHRHHHKSHTNPFFHMLYCSETEADMIKWPSKYKQKQFEISASDAFSKKAELLTKKIAKEFFQWWTDLGTLEFKSEIRRAEDIEDLFQVWFDEHASRSLVIDPRVLPCVLETIAVYVGLPRASCMKVLGRQLAYDIHAEESPAHLVTFGTCLPQHMKHIPPNNNTKKQWEAFEIPEDLKTMSCVWGDISHLTSSKSFYAWLRARPHLAMPACFRKDSKPAATEKKQQFVMPSDFVLREKSSQMSMEDLALPVSQFTMELKDVLHNLMSQ